MSKGEEIPQGWGWTTLGEIRFDRAKGIEPAKSPDQLFELYSVPSFDERTPEIVRGCDVGSNKQTVEPGTVLLCKINPRINRAWLVGDRTTLPQIASTEWIPFFPMQHVEPRYLQYYLSLHKLRDYLAARASGVGGSLTRVNPRVVADYPMPLAPFAEQRRIVAAIEEQFTRLDAGVAALERVRANLKRYRAAVLKAAVEGKLTEEWRAQHPDIEPADVLLQRILDERRRKWEEAELEKYAKAGKTPPKGWQGKYKEPVQPEVDGLPELPEEWTWATIHQLAAPEPNSITDGPFGSNLKTEHYVPEGPRVLRLQNIGDGVFRDEKAHITKVHFDRLRKHEVFEGDLVIAALGERPPRSCLVPQGIGLAIVKADCIRFKPSPHVHSTFVNYALNSEPTRHRTTALLHGVGRPRLNLSEIKSIIIPLCPLREQEWIVAEVERRLSVVAQMEGQIAANMKRSSRLRQSILKRAFEGKLVPQDPTDEPASVLLERIRHERETGQNGRGRNRTAQDGQKMQMRLVDAD